MRIYGGILSSDEINFQGISRNIKVNHSFNFENLVMNNSHFPFSIGYFFFNDELYYNNSKAGTSWKFWGYVTYILNAVTFVTVLSIVHVIYLNRCLRRIVSIIVQLTFFIRNKISFTKIYIYIRHVFSCKYAIVLLQVAWSDGNVAYSLRNN